MSVAKEGKEILLEQPKGSAQSQNLKVVQAGSAQQFEHCIRENFEAWGEGLSIQNYFKREMTLANSNFSKNRNTWILIEGEEDTCLDILSACESYQHDSIIVYPDGKSMKGFCMSIASVFTAERYRKRGYAAQLLSKVLERAKSLAGCLASALYSDIGPSYYSKLGWICRKSISLCLKFDDLKAEVENDSDLNRIEYLTLSACRPLVERASELIPKDALEKAKEEGIPVISLIPKYDSQEWFFMRSQFYFEHFSPYTPPGITNLEYCGFKCKDSPSFALFMFDFKEQSLKVTMARFYDEIGTKSLLAALSSYAKFWKLKQVEIWDPEENVQEWGRSLGYRMEERQDHLSSLCTSGFKTGDISEEPFWLYNEKMFWV